jgi:acetyl esterase/lipase
VDIAPAIKRSQLIGVLLHCGPYKIREGEGVKIGDFSRVPLWSYSGRKGYGSDPYFATASVIDYLTKDFPPVFISAGNGDPLLPQSLAMSAALTGLGVRVDSLFFPADYQPPLPHEYQLNLDDEAGRLALERSVEFLSGL